MKPFKPHVVVVGILRGIFSETYLNSRNAFLPVLSRDSKSEGFLSLFSTTPAVAAGVELEAWDLERVVKMTADYCKRKRESEQEENRARAGI